MRGRRIYGEVYVPQFPAKPSKWQSQVPLVELALGLNLRLEDAFLLLMFLILYVPRNFIFWKLYLTFPFNCPALHAQITGCQPDLCILPSERPVLRLQVALHGRALAIRPSS